MAITTSTSGSADNDSILTIQIVRAPTAQGGDLQVEVGYKVGDGSRTLTLEPTGAFKASIEATYAEIKAAIDTAEGLS
jgi:hypothetical protein